jgi:hypothetical protein
MKPANWPPYMIEKRLSSGAVGYYWNPPIRPRNSAVLRVSDATSGKGALIYGDAAPDQTSKIAFQRVPKVKEF